VIYTDAMEMVRRYSEASIDKSIEKDSFRKFNDYYNEADVLIIDDVQGLQGKRETLTAVFQIFNKLTNMGKQVVLAADRAPKNIDLEERYVSRFNSGTTIDIQPPDTETKRNIALGYLLQLEEERGGEKIAISDDILDYLAENSSSNIRELKSAITRLVFEIRNSPEGEISLTKAKEILSNHFINDMTVRITPDIIFGAVESFFKVSHTEILGKKRTRSIVHPRQIAIYLIREMTDLTYLDIAKIMGKDHSTIIHSYNLIDEKLAENREVFEEIEAIKELIKSREF
jgi:chromosomal replication initiator protein